MSRKRTGGAILAAAMLAGSLASASAADKFITVQSTTSTQASGLYDYLLPKFTDATGIEVRVVAVGTGQAIKNAENCDGDVLVVHARPAEQTFVEAGYGTGRTDLMYNDFVLVGPASDPAGIAGMMDVQAALKKIAEAEAPFASRGDDSGTHKAEMALWKQTGVDPTAASGGWYRETGSGMGQTLNTAVGMDAYSLTDRATWISFREQGQFRRHGRGRHGAVQPVRRHPGQPRALSERQGGHGADLCRLAALGRGAGGDRELSGGRPAAVLPERARAGEDELTPGPGPWRRETPL